MVVLKTESETVFHEAEELLRLFLGMTMVRAEAVDAEPVSYTICIETTCENGQWRATAKESSRQLQSSATYPVLGQDLLLQRRAQSRAVKFALFQLMKQLLPQSNTPWGALTGIRPTKLLYEYMGRGLSAQEAGNILREDYGVRQDKVEILLDIARMQQGVRGVLPTRMLDVYIGIPFCPSRCRYCSFASCDVHKFGHLRDAYIDALLLEMRQMRDYMQAHGLKTGNLYIGGGTPTALTDEQLERLLEACADFAPESGEFTLEAGRPDTITSQKLSLARDFGVTRISINPQSMHDETLIRIGRKHLAAQIEEAFALARRAGFKRINMDLIAGLSGETPQMFAQSLQRVIDLAPENVTVHTLSVKRASILHETIEQTVLTDASDVDKMVCQARQTLREHAYYPYYLYRQKYMSGNLENVGYTLTGAQCGYNVDVMEETHSNLAMGAGAITKWYDPKHNLIRRAANVRNVEQYIARSVEMAQKKIDLALAMFGETACSQ